MHLRQQSSIPCLPAAVCATALIALLTGCGRDQGKRERSAARSPEYAGAKSCIPCHKEFYDLWAPSFHSLAMQVFSPDLLDKGIIGPPQDVRVGKSVFRAEIHGDRMTVKETGDDIDREYPVTHTCGGKNITYFLTELAPGHLQVLPTAWDVRRKEWFNTPESAVRHYPEMEDAPIEWTDPAYTFNTACYNCHISERHTNYDPATHEYFTSWNEMGVNCENCHGPAAEHVRVCKRAGKKPPADAKILTYGSLTHGQVNDLCAPCHAKMRPLTGRFLPGDNFFDHYDLVTLENVDFYPDGRDLGENYTHTLWLMSPCAKSGSIDCNHCHTPSGRYRFKNEQPNGACSPCHMKNVENIAAHSHHDSTGKAGECISCHMPQTEFARMIRTDHSMRPPMPGASIEFGSPNACNICHTDSTAEWAEASVGKWRKGNFQEEALRKGRLVRRARRHDWTVIDSILAFIDNDTNDEIYATSLVRLLASCTLSVKIPTLLSALGTNHSPLVRSAAAMGLAGILTDEVHSALVAATHDKYRLVRLAAAECLCGFPGAAAVMTGNDSLYGEYRNSLICRTDVWNSHYNLANFYRQMGHSDSAGLSYETAIRMAPGNPVPLVNAALLLAEQGKRTKAEEYLRKAVVLDSGCIAANTNLALLLGELGRSGEAEKIYRRVYRLDTTSAVAAYNLSVIISMDSPAEAVLWSGRAAANGPEQPKYPYTHAFYLNKTGKTREASQVLKKVIMDHPGYPDSYFLLALIMERNGNRAKAAEVIKRLLRARNLPEKTRVAAARRFEALTRRTPTDSPTQIRK